MNAIKRTARHVPGVNEEGQVVEEAGAGDELFPHKIDGMNQRAWGRKKEIESAYLHEARRLTDIFPPGEFVPHENPDFLITTEGKTYGIEVTELCLEKPRTEAATLERIPENAKTLYNQRTGAVPVDVSIVYSRQAESLHPNQMAKSLAAFIYEQQGKKGVYGWQVVPEGFSRIGIHDVLPTRNPAGRWYGVRAFSVEIAIRELLERSIARKNARLPAYRSAASNLWLLIVNDQFLGPGEVYVRPEDLSVWSFTFRFEKVLLFAREADGGGKVYELQRSDE
jgi:hypothetical protein